MKRSNPRKKYLKNRNEEDRKIGEDTHRGGRGGSFWQKVSKPKKLAKKITQFTIEFLSKNLTHFTSLNSLNIVKNILSQHRQKPYSLYKFSSKHVSGWCQKKNIALQHF